MLNTHVHTHTPQKKRKFPLSQHPSDVIVLIMCYFKDVQDSACEGLCESAVGSQTVSQRCSSPSPAQTLLLQICSHSSS